MGVLAGNPRRSSGLLGVTQAGRGKGKGKGGLGGSGNSGSRPPGGGGANNDPFFANVVALLHMDGSGGSTSFPDNSSGAKTFTNSGNASVSNIFSKFGNGSLELDSVGDWIQTVSNLVDFRFGTGDFTIELQVKTGLTNRVLIDFYAPTIAGSYQIYIGTGGVVQWWASNGTTGAKVTEHASANISDNAWHHVVVCRVSGITRIFVDGVEGGAVADTRDYAASTVGIWAIGAQVFDRVGTYDFGGYIDEVRVTKGVGRYTSSFTPPTSAFPNS